MQVQSFAHNCLIFLPNAETLTGKTFLFNAIIEHLIQSTKGNLNIATIFFYCKYNDPQTKTHEEISKSLIAQLLKNNQNCLDYLYDFAMKSGERYAKGKKSFSEILYNLIQCYDQIFLGIDGLDECEPAERKQAISMLQSLLRAPEQGSILQILLCSRAEKDIERSLTKCKRLHIKSQNLSTPIRTYVGIRLASLNEIFRFRASNLKEIALQISDQSEGMDCQ